MALDLPENVVLSKLDHLANEFRTTLRKIGKGDPPPQTWHAGFYFMSALVRLSPLLHRLGLNSMVEQSRVHVREDVNPHFVIVNTFDIKSVRVLSRNDEAGILVDRPLAPRPFEDSSSLFRSINQASTSAVW